MGWLKNIKVIDVAAPHAREIAINGL